MSNLKNDELRMRVIKQKRLIAAQPAPSIKRRGMPVFNGKTGLAQGLSGLSTREMLGTADDVACILMCLLECRLLSALCQHASRHANRIRVFAAKFRYKTV
jgi:hypothetical protein